MSPFSLRNARAALRALVCFATLGALVSTAPLRAQEAETNDEDVWFRVVRQDDAPVKMQTSVVRYSGLYVADDGTQREVAVDLIGAVHIAESSYYAELNEIFKDYDVVVYELVSNGDAPTNEEKREKMRVGANPLGWVSVLQQVFGSSLGLTYQMEGIDYGADNMRRGDCTPEELIAKTLSNGDLVSFFFNAVLSSVMATDAGDGDAMALALLCASDRQLAARRLFAIELERSSLQELKRETKATQLAEDGDEDSSESERETAIIHFRNDKALEVVAEELDAGRTKVAVFYGAAHLPDMGSKLEDSFDLERLPDVRWVTAWDMTRKEK